MERYIFELSKWSVNMSYAQLGIFGLTVALVSCGTAETARQPDNAESPGQQLGKDGAKQSGASTAAALKTTCDGGDAKGCFRLGLMYDQGEGVQRRGAGRVAVRKSL